MSFSYAPTLLVLLNELLYEISKNIEYSRDLSAFSMNCKHINELCCPVLQLYALKDCVDETLTPIHATCIGDLYMLKIVLNYMKNNSLDVNSVT